jgi:hypothetical protein
MQAGMKPARQDGAPHYRFGRSSLLLEPMHGKGRDGIEVVARATFAWTFRDGAIEGGAVYQERQDALEALGLSEPGAHVDT